MVFLFEIEPIFGHSFLFNYIFCTELKKKLTTKMEWNVEIKFIYVKIRIFYYSVIIH